MKIRPFLLPSSVAALVLGLALLAQRTAAQNAPTNASGNPAQIAAVNQLDAATAGLSQEVNTARTALAAASLALPADPAAITRQAEALAQAELQLALARANGLAPLQSGPNRLNATQIAVLRNRAAAATGGRGGFGRGSREALNIGDLDGYVSIFDGQTLNGWDGAAANWTVEDGAITARNGQPVGTTYIIWTGGRVRDFELKLEYKIQGGNTGLQYRSRRNSGIAEGHGGHLPDVTPDQVWDAPGAQRTPPFGRGGDESVLRNYAQWDIGGYQFDLGGQNTGQLYEQDGRGIVVLAGSVGELLPGLTGPRFREIGQIGDTSDVDKPGEWNSIHLIAIGNSLTHIVNGRLMSQSYDNDPDYFSDEGVLALQIEGNGLVQFRNIYLKQH